MESNEVQMVEYFDEHIYRIKSKGVLHNIASVTTKLSVEDKPFISRWRGDIGNREADLRMNEASDRGKRIHYAWWVYVNGGTIIYNPWQRPNYTEEDIKKLKEEVLGNGRPLSILQSQDEMLQVWKLQRFFETVNPKPLHTELIVYSIDLDIAGTLDNAFFIEKGTYDVSGRSKLVIPKSGIYIADLKTGKAFDEAMWNQVAPYAKCYELMGYGKPNGGLILHTGSNIKTGIAGLSVPFRSSEELVHDFDVYMKIAEIWKERNPNYSDEVFEFPSLIKRKEAA